MNIDYSALESERNRAMHSYHKSSDMSRTVGRKPLSDDVPLPHDNRFNLEDDFDKKPGVNSRCKRV